MKPAGKPPMPSLPKGAANAARPSFPVQLKPAAGMPTANKNMTAPARVTNAAGPASALKVAQKPVPSGIGLDSHAVRARMVQKLAAQGVTDPQVLAAMGQVERHRFVDSALVNQAYEDTSLPIGLGQTISKPNVVARMLELLMRSNEGRQGKLGRVLEIGTGCGYQAAVLAQLAQEVYSIERLRGLHDKARDNLRPLRLPNVHLMFGDGMIGYAKGAPYAAIISAAGGENIPGTWIDQLAMGGRLVAPLQSANGTQVLVVVDKTPQGVKQTLLEAVHFVPLKSGTS
ncbi:MAG: protein-L-isoaspartate(D-aspartate) O-methyltransferase [Pseudomonadota bacterium]